jgi:hypothetical protein
VRERALNINFCKFMRALVPGIGPDSAAVWTLRIRRDCIEKSAAGSVPVNELTPIEYSVSAV